MSTWLPHPYAGAGFQRHSRGGGDGEGSGRAQIRRAMADFEQRQLALCQSAARSKQDCARYRQCLWWPQHRQCLPGGVRPTSEPFGSLLDLARREKEKQQAEAESESESERSDVSLWSPSDSETPSPPSSPEGRF